MQIVKTSELVDNFKIVVRNKIHSALVFEFNYLCATVHAMLANRSEPLAGCGN